MSFTAQDVKALRESTGAGMMDCKKALQETDGDMDAAKTWLREKGLAASAKREDREASQGVVSLLIDGNVGAIVELKSETDFVAGSDQFKAEADALAALVVAKGVDAVSERATELEELKVTLKENIGLGEVKRIEAAEGNVIGSYQHIQGGRGVNGVLVEIANGTPELAHDVAVHIAFARPQYLSRDDVPDDVVAAERATLEVISRNEGKPEAALPKIVEGRINGFFKDVALLDQPYAKDDKQSVAQFIGAATIVQLRPGRNRLSGSPPTRPPVLVNKSATHVRNEFTRWALGSATFGRPSPARVRSATTWTNRPTLAEAHARRGSASSSSPRVKHSPASRARGSTAPRSPQPRETSSTSDRTSVSTSPWSSAAATSGVAEPAR